LYKPTINIYNNVATNRFDKGLTQLHYDNICEALSYNRNECFFDRKDVAATLKKVTGRNTTIIPHIQEKQAEEIHPNLS
jgi:hypothetical protein